MKMFKDYYDEDYDPIEESENGVRMFRLFHTDEDYERRHDYERGIKPFNDDDDCCQDDCDSCIGHFKD